MVLKHEDRGGRQTSRKGHGKKKWGFERRVRVRSNIIQQNVRV